MLNSLHNPLSLVGRLLMSVLFLPAGISKIAGFAGTVGYIASKGAPVPEIAAIIAIIVEVGGGLALILGFKARWAALALAAFTLVATVMFHNYWTFPAEQQMMQQLMFMKNVAVIGGLLTLAAWGAGAWSVDGKSSR